MAQQYPHSTFHGIDIAEQFPNEIKPFNCHFQVANVTEKLPFPDNYFDYIHQRLLVAALTRDGWNNVPFRRPTKILLPPINTIFSSVCQSYSGS